MIVVMWKCASWELTPLQGNHANGKCDPALNIWSARDQPSLNCAPT
jgi:hypothetical protein